MNGWEPLMGPLPTFFYSLMHCNAVNIYFQDTFQDLVNSQGLFQEISLAQSQQQEKISVLKSCVWQEALDI